MSPEPTESDTRSASAESTAVCVACRRTVSIGMTKASDVVAGRISRRCKGLLKRSCDAIAAERAKAKGQ